MVAGVADYAVDDHRQPVERSPRLARSNDRAVPKLLACEVREGRFFAIVDDENPVLVGHLRPVVRTKGEATIRCVGTIARGSAGYRGVISRYLGTAEEDRLGSDPSG